MFACEQGNRQVVELLLARDALNNSRSSSCICSTSTSTSTSTSSSLSWLPAQGALRSGAAREAAPIPGGVSRGGPGARQACQADACRGKGGRRLDVFARDIFGTTPLDAAHSRGNKQLEDLLLAASRCAVADY